MTIIIITTIMIIIITTTIIIITILITVIIGVRMIKLVGNYAVIQLNFIVFFCLRLTIWH